MRDVLTPEAGQVITLSFAPVVFPVPSSQFPVFCVLLCFDRSPVSLVLEILEVHRLLSF